MQGLCYMGGPGKYALVETLHMNETSLAFHQYFYRVVASQRTLLLLVHGSMAQLPSRLTLPTGLVSWPTHIAVFKPQAQIPYHKPAKMTTAKTISPEPKVTYYRKWILIKKLKITQLDHFLIQSCHNKYSSLTSGLGCSITVKVWSARSDQH